MKNKKEGSTVETAVRDASEYCLSTIPLLVECLKNVTRETEEAALSIMQNLREILRKSSVQESGISINQLLLSLQFQDITRQETEKVIASLISLKERLEAVSKQISGGSEVDVRPRIIETTSLSEPVEDCGESVVLF